MGEKTNSPILTEVHGAARSLHKHGIIGGSRMSEYDALCLDPVPSCTPEMISNLRKRWDLTQTAFARVLNASLSTVQKWEAGRKNPPERQESFCISWRRKEYPPCSDFALPAEKRARRIDV